MRECAECHRTLPRRSYTLAQHNRGVGISRCAACVHGHHSDFPSKEVSAAGRFNHALTSAFKEEDLDNPFAHGSFRYVAKGRYTSGERSGQPCVTKWFMERSENEEKEYKNEFRIVDKSLEIVNRFNDLNMVDKTIKINIPELWEFDSSAGKWAGFPNLSEPFIENYEKFNSNTGWSNTSTTWGQVMQALSHFSYHVTGGVFLLCDLQGGVYLDEVILSDPAIISRTGERYGVTDLRKFGIEDFFAKHVCNGFCRPHWAKPARPRRSFVTVPSTTMIKRDISTAYSRARGSGGPIRTQQPGTRGPSGTQGYGWFED